MRRVRRNGEIKWRNDFIFLSQVLVGEPVGLEPLDEGRWRVHYGPIALGHLTAEGRFEHPKSKWGPACGFVDSARALPTTPQAPPPQQTE